VPFFLWLHLSDGGRPDALATQLGRVHDALRQAGVQERTLVVGAGTHGRGSQGLFGLDDGLVRVPLWVHAPRLRAKSLDVEAQVRLMDVAPTVLDYLRLDPMEPAEGVDLLGYAEGVRKQPMWCSLVGRGGDDLFDTVLLGMRNNGLKYVRDVRGGTEQLYDLTTDPGEQDDLSETHLETLEKARGMVASEEIALRRVLLEGGP
jgi:arylsulfatase A-like enzyme